MLRTTTLLKTLLISLFVLLIVSSARSVYAGNTTEPSDPFTCDAVLEIPKAECNALVSLYHSTNGPGWANQAGWLATNTPCSWYGVRCQAEHVDLLYLYRNQLSGAIPVELGNLAGLRYLVEARTLKTQPGNALVRFIS